MENKTKIIPLAMVMLTAFLLVPQLQQVANASSNSPYESGRDHGCDDAELSPSDRYINEPGKGPSFHTDEFMSGYHDGFRECGGGSSGGSRSDIVQDFCSALNRDDYAEAEGLLLLLDYGSISVAARTLCGIVDLMGQ